MQPEDENGGKKKQKNGGSLGVVVQQRASKVIFLLRPAAVDMLEQRNRLSSLAHLHVYSAFQTSTPLNCEL